MKNFPSFLLVREKMREKAKIGASKMLKTPAFLGRFEKTIDKISILTVNHTSRFIAFDKPALFIFYFLFVPLVSSLSYWLNAVRTLAHN